MRTPPATPRPAPPPAAAQPARGRAQQAEPGEWSGVRPLSRAVVGGVVSALPAPERGCGWGLGGDLRAEPSPREPRDRWARAGGRWCFRHRGRALTRSMIPGTGAGRTRRVCCCPDGGVGSRVTWAPRGPREPPVVWRLGTSARRVWGLGREGDARAGPRGGLPGSAASTWVVLLASGRA